MTPLARRRLLLAVLAFMLLSVAVPLVAAQDFSGIWERAFSPFSGLIRLIFGPWEAYTVKFAVFILLFALFYGIIRGLPQFQETTNGVRITIPLILALISAAFMPDNLALAFGHAWGGFWGFALTMSLAIIVLIIGFRNTTGGTPARTFMYGLALVLGGVSLMMGYRLFSAWGQTVDQWLGLPLGRAVGVDAGNAPLVTGFAPADVGPMPTSFFADLMFGIGGIMLFAGVILTFLGLYGMISGAARGIGFGGGGGGIGFGAGGSARAGGGGAMPPAGTPPGVTPPGGGGGPAPPGHPARIRGIAKDAGTNATIRGQYVWLQILREEQLSFGRRRRVIYPVNPATGGPGWWHSITQNDGSYQFDYDKNLRTGDQYFLTITHGAIPPAPGARFNPETQTGTIANPDWNDIPLSLTRPGGGVPHEITMRLLPQTREANNLFRTHVADIGRELQEQIRRARARPPERVNLNVLRAHIHEAQTHYRRVYEGFFEIFNHPEWGHLTPADQAAIQQELAQFAAAYRLLHRYVRSSRRTLRARPTVP